MCEPTAYVLILNEAEFPTNGTLLLKTVLPSLKVTLPPDVPEPEEAFTIEVKVTDCPKIDGLLDDASNVEVDTGATGWVPRKSCMVFASIP